MALESGLEWVWAHWVSSPIRVRLKTDFPLALYAREPTKVVLTTS
jgi:hypothetical protein